MMSYININGMKRSKFNKCYTFALKTFLNINYLYRFFVNKFIFVRFITQFGKTCLIEEVTFGLNIKSIQPSIWGFWERISLSLIFTLYIQVDVSLWKHTFVID